MALQVWLPLNRDLRNQGTDTICNWYQSPNASCTYNSNGYYDFSGYTGFGISNSTSLDYISTEFFSRYLNNHSFSCSIWVKTASGFDLSSSNGGALITIGYGISFRFGASGVPLIWVTGTDGAGGTVGNGTAATTNCNDQKWHHLAFSYNVDDNAIKIYIDGVCEGTAYYPSGYSFVGNWTNNITIGKDVNAFTANNRYFFQGSLYDFRIYDHALSAKEVKEISKGLYLHYTFAVNHQTMNNAFTYPTFNTSNSNGGWSHWGNTGYHAEYSQNINKDYIYNKFNTYSHYVKCYSDSPVSYICYQSPTFGGGYRSAQAIIKMEDGSEPNTSKINIYFNAGVGSSPPMQYIPLGDGFYLIKREGFQQDGSNDLVDIAVAPGNAVYISEAYLENHMKCCSDIFGHKTTNLITSLVAGGQTTVSDNNVTTSGTDADTYFKLNLSEALVSGYTYTISCDAELPTGTYWNFPIGSQSNTSLTWRIVPGYNEYTFIANSSCTGNPLMMDDTGGTARTAATVCKFNNLWLVRTGVQTITDNSGFNNNGTITGDLITNTNSPRYSRSTKFNSSVVRMKDPLTSTIDEYTITGWIYPTNSSYMTLWNGRSTAGAATAVFYTSENKIRFDDGGTQIHSTTTLPLNTWSHFACTYKTGGQKCIYVNGLLTNDVSASTSTRSKSNVYATIGLGSTADSTPSGYPIIGNISDIRIYKKQLSSSDILDLYQTGCAVDKSQNAFTYELNESDSQTTVDVKKNGQLVCKNFSETLTSAYDDNAYVESDGSVWIRIFHHNNPSGGLFGSTDDFAKRVYKDANRWFDVSACNRVISWELMVKQKTTSSATEKKWRWIQNVNPMTAVFGDVDVADITKHLGSGYASWTNNCAGIYKKNSSSYIVQNDGNSGNWWGAMGSWTAYNSGIPGFNKEAVTTGYLDLYLCIYSGNLNVKTYLSKYDPVWFREQGEFQLDDQDFYCYDGETVTYNGEKCYVWYRYEKDEKSIYDPTGKNDEQFECKVLTNTLDIRLPFTERSPEYVASLTGDDDLAYNALKELEYWGYDYNEVPADYRNFVIERTRQSVGPTIIRQIIPDSNNITRICKNNATVTANEINEI